MTSIANIGLKNRPLVYCDAQNLPPSANRVVQYDQFITNAVRQRVPFRWDEEIFKAFVANPSGQAAKELRKRGWIVPKSSANCDRDVRHCALSDAGQAPDRSIVFLITQDTDFVTIIHELQSRGIEVYLIAPPDVSSKLRSAVDFMHFIALPPELP